MVRTTDALLTAAAEMAATISEYAEEIDLQSRLPEALAQQLKEAGFFRMLLGTEFGGLEVDPITAARVVETISRANASTGWVVMILSATAYWASSQLSDDSAKEIFLSGPEVTMAGTLVPAGKAAKVEGGWLLNGRWPFASGCMHADWMGSGSFLHEGDELLRKEDGSPEMRLFLSPVSECEILGNWDTTGLRGTGSHDYVLDNVFVPERFVIQHPLQSDRSRPGAHYAYPAVATPMMAAVSMGAARAAVDGLTTLLNEKKDRRSGQPAFEDTDKQAALGSAEALVGSAGSYLYEVFEEVLETVRKEEVPSHRLRGRFRLACTNSVLSSVKVVDEVYAAGGATSIYRSSNLERLFRDVHTAAAHAFMRPGTFADGGKLLLELEPPLRIF